MLPLAEAVRKIFEPFERKSSTPETRQILESRLNYYFETLDRKGYPRPVDFNIDTDDKGGLVVFFSKDFTGD